jgi:beta-galactosidase
VQGNLRPSPQFEEVKKAYQEIHTSGDDLSNPDLKIKIANEYFFRSLNHLNASWKLLKDGMPVGEGKLSLPEIAPQQSHIATIATGYQPIPDGEYMLRLRYDLKETNAWHPAGMPIAWDEIPLPWGKRITAPAPASSSSLSYTEDASSIHILNGSTKVTLSKATGTITSLQAGEQALLSSPLQLNFWRPATNNDEGAKLHHKRSIWQHAGARATATKIITRKEGNDILVTADVAIPVGDSRATIEYRFHGTSHIDIHTTAHIAKGVPELPRIGYTTTIPAIFASMKWYGKGPQETYCDRQDGAWTTLHENYIPGMFYRYTDAQESGNLTNVRWAQLSSPVNTNALHCEAIGQHLLEVAAYPCLLSDISIASHGNTILPRDVSTLCLDHRQSGLGGTNSWGALPLPQYRLMSGTSYDWTMRLSLKEVAVAARPSPIRRIPGLPNPSAPGLPPIPSQPTLPGLPPGLTLPENPQTQ